MTKELFEEITTWQDKTFPESTELSRVRHLLKEVQELECELELFDRKQEKILEYADCFFLLFGAAKKMGMTYDDICAAIEVKFNINKKRQWGKPDKDGVVEHIK